MPTGCPATDLSGGIIAPGFVDLQINGGGGVMFNDDQSVETLRPIADAHASIGTTAVLPTVITDTPARTAGEMKVFRRGPECIVSAWLDCGPR